MSLRPIDEKLKGVCVCFAFSLIRIHYENGWSNPLNRSRAGFQSLLQAAVSITLVFSAVVS